MAPALHAEFTQSGKVGKVEAQEPLCILMLLLPFLGHSAVPGTDKGVNTGQRFSQRVKENAELSGTDKDHLVQLLALHRTIPTLKITLPFFSPKVLSPTH